MHGVHRQQMGAGSLSRLGPWLAAAQCWPPAAGTTSIGASLLAFRPDTGYYQSIAGMSNSQLVLVFNTTDTGAVRARARVPMCACVDGPPGVRARGQLRGARLCSRGKRAPS